MAVKWSLSALCVWVCLVVFRASHALSDAGGCSATIDPGPVYLNATVVAWRKDPHLRPYLSARAGQHRRCFWLYQLLLLAGDIERNPGPTGRRWKFPCGVCSAPVRRDQRGVQCEICGFWLHARCIGLSIEDYAVLQHSEDPWACKKCLKEVMPFGNISNSDSIFNSSSFSSPSPAPSIPQQLLPTPPNSLSVLYTNCRSLISKIDDFRLLASSHSPHIIAICESWLDCSISDAELHIPGYSLVRRDRDRHGGGLALFISDSLSFEAQSLSIHQLSSP